MRNTVGVYHLSLLEKNHSKTFLCRRLLESFVSTSATILPVR